MAKISSHNFAIILFYFLKFVSIPQSLKLKTWFFFFFFIIKKSYFIKLSSHLRQQTFFSLYCFV